MSNDKENLYTRESLLDLGIYDLRELGRDVGVVSPTTLKKEQLVDAILSVIYGEAPKRNVGKGRGRPSRNKNKPCQLFVDLVNKIEEPILNINFVDADYSFDEYESQFMGAVASSKNEYSADKDGSVSVLTGVVNISEQGAQLKKFKFVDSHEDVNLSNKIVQQYDLKDNDVVEALCDKKNKQVLQVLKVNDGLALGDRPVANKREQSVQVEVLGKTITTNASNLVYLPVLKEREQTIDKIAKTFEDLDYNIVKVCFDRNGKAQKVNSKKVELFADCIGDEYETIAMAEEGAKRVSFLNNTQGKTVLIIDNIGWLKSVVDTYPKEVYGNFIEKILRLTKGDQSNITVICAIAKSKTDNQDIYSLFDYVV